MGLLKIDRKDFIAHRRVSSWAHVGAKAGAAKARKRRWRVSSAKYRIRDIGAPGRGPKTKTKRIETRQPGMLTRFGYGVYDSSDARRRAISRAVHAYGATDVWRGLHAQAQLREEADAVGPRPRPRRGEEQAWESFRSDRDWMKREFAPDVTPREAVRKWKTMSRAARASAKTGG